MLAYRFLFLAVSLCWLTPSAGQEAAQTPPASRPLKVMLVGNSLTYTNSLASKLTSFANASNQARPWQVFEQAMPNARLSQMWSLGTTEHMLNDEPWDYIVLQENGNVYPEGLFSAARKFDDAARKIGAKVILFENWRGSASSQAEMTNLFVKLGKELAVQVAPVGQAWRLVRERDPSIQLKESDGVHPSSVGQYVAGCVIYMTIAETDACPEVLVGSIDEHVSSVTREAAQQAVANSRAVMRAH